MPPLRSLQAFAAAVRHGSFREAARSLGVTPPAISHHVRALEDHVGAPLFIRGVRRVEPTPLGKALGEAVVASLEDMDRALARARCSGAAAMLRVTSLPMFTSTWLLPRLSGFQDRHPTVQIEIESSSRVVDLEVDPFDVAIRHLDQPTPGVTCFKLLDLRATPLCAPKIAARLAAIDDLMDETLIHMGSGRDGWRRWLDAAGRDDLSPRQGLTVDSVPAGLDAALHGRGVVLGLIPLVFDTPQAQGLVAPFARTAPEAGAYFVAHRKGDRGNPTIQAFVSWMRQEMRRP
ncbi:MAG TPA: LysR substrate-binding domain-containing protein [Brevundimonas sp.]|nr:LysR substrate-binding domain-containing protein [Brevundimonas sp.]